jgi:hypothetical protein
MPTTLYYAWRKPGSNWSKPVPLFPPDPTRGVKFSYAPSLTTADGGMLALVFYDIYDGAAELGFDTSLDILRGGHLAGPPLTVTDFVRRAVLAKQPETAMGPRFPGAAPTIFHRDGKTWLDVLETIQSPFEPVGANIIVYQRLDIGSRLR